jgi:hypothetical protein
MLHAEGDTLADQAGAIEDFLHIGRAYAVAGGLDHLIASTDKVQEPVCIPPHGIAGKHRVLGKLQSAGQSGHRSVALGGLFGVVPVAQTDQCATMHQLARLVHIALAAVFAQYDDLRVGDCPADRVGSSVDLLGRQVG